MRPNAPTLATAGAFEVLSKDGRLNQEHIATWLSMLQVVVATALGATSTQIAAAVTPGVPTRSATCGMVVGWMTMRRPVFGEPLLDALSSISKLSTIVVVLDQVLSQLGSSCGDDDELPRYELQISTVTRLTFHVSVAVAALLGGLVTLVSNPADLCQRTVGLVMPYSATALFLVVHPVGLESSASHRPLCEAGSLAIAATRVTRSVAFVCCFQVALATELSKLRNHSRIVRHDVSMELALRCTSNSIFALVCPAVALPGAVLLFVVVACFRRRVSSLGMLKLFGLQPLSSRPYAHLDDDDAEEGKTVSGKGERADRRRATPPSSKTVDSSHDPLLPDPPRSPCSDDPLVQNVTTNTEDALSRLKRIGVPVLSKDEAARVLMQK